MSDKLTAERLRALDEKAMRGDIKAAREIRDMLFHNRAAILAMAEEQDRKGGRIDELQETLDDAEDSLVEDFMRPDSAMRARCTICKAEAFHRESIDHQKHCFVGNIRRALGKDQAS